jgi:glutamate-ammonia-ligase adenylyltransferase
LHYENLGGADESNGERPLPLNQYFTRLTQRLVAAVTAPTGEGVLYQADMRLRPSGNAGPLATSLPGFITYHQDHAWTWEHLALTRTRVVFADPGMQAAIDAAVRAQIEAPRDVPKTIDDVISMRALMQKERPTRHPFDLKLAAGGLVDLEFIAQSAQLVAGKPLDVRQAPTATVLTRLGETGLVPQGERLAEIHSVYSAILQVMSAALTDPFKPEAWTPAFQDLLAGLTNYPSFALLADDIKAMQAEVSAAAEEWYASARGLE